jgi:hypothetical protein
MDSQVLVKEVLKLTNSIAIVGRSHCNEGKQINDFEAQLASGAVCGVRCVCVVFPQKCESGAIMRKTAMALAAFSCSEVTIR